MPSPNPLRVHLPELTAFRDAHVKTQGERVKTAGICEPSDIAREKTKKAAEALQQVRELWREVLAADGVPQAVKALQRLLKVDAHGRIYPERAVEILTLPPGKGVLGVVSGWERSGRKRARGKR